MKEGHHASRTGDDELDLRPNIDERTDRVAKAQDTQVVEEATPSVTIGDQIAELVVGQVLYSTTC